MMTNQERKDRLKLYCKFPFFIGTMILTLVFGLMVFLPNLPTAVRCLLCLNAGVGIGAQFIIFTLIGNGKLNPSSDCKEDN